MTIRLRELRLRRGWSQHELERRTGVSQKSISNYERGIQAPGAATLVKLAHMLGVSAAYLMGQTDEPAREGPLPPDWIEVIEEAIAKGLTPDHVRIAIRLIEIAASHPVAGTDVESETGKQGPTQPGKS